MKECQIVRVINPFTKPTAIPIDKPKAIANQGGIP
jgi:hypothetical protein